MALVSEKERWNNLFTGDSLIVTKYQQGIPVVVNGVVDSKYRQLDLFPNLW